LYFFKKYFREKEDGRKARVWKDFSKQVSNNGFTKLGLFQTVFKCLQIFSLLVLIQIRKERVYIKPYKQNRK
jgi:hypothetical protein